MKNQFRALDDDEIGFLDEVLEASRAKDAAVKRDTAEQLELFRQHQEKSERAALGETTEDKGADVQSWAVGGKKRKRTKDKGVLPGVKLRKSSSIAEKPLPETMNGQSPPGAQVEPETASAATKPTATMMPSKVAVPTPSISSTHQAATSSASPVSGLGLGGYSSDEE